MVLLLHINSVARRVDGVFRAMSSGALSFLACVRGADSREVFSFVLLKVISGFVP